MSKSMQSEYEQVLRAARELDLAQRLRLIADLASDIRGDTGASPLITASPPEPAHSVLELDGLGRELWAGVDAVEYVRRERDSWDG